MVSMFRSKKDVDRHVTDVLSKIHNENERNLRGYSFARLYYQIKDYETAKKHLVGYLSVRDHHAPAHKLMGQLFESTKNVERALHSYKRSLEVDSNQKEIVLKICELYCQLPVDHETARYWADRADQLFPHHETVFRLRECLVSAEGEPDRQELEHLLAAELSAQPMNVPIRIKLLKLYLDTERIKEAYVHAVKVESKRPFTSSTDWYYCLVDIFEAYQEEVGQELDSDFYINFLSVLDHLVSLTLTEPHALRFGYDQKTAKHSSSINDAVSVLCTFDQVLKKASDKDLKEGPWLYFLHHMKGQLYYHMGTLIMKRAIKDQGNWKEACRVGAALFLISYTFKPQNLLQEVWFSRMNEKQKLFTNFFQQAALRTSCNGHIIISLCKEEKSRWLQKIKRDVCVAQVQERTYNRLFSSVGQKQTAQTSYFLQDTTFVNTSLEFPSLAALKDYDKSAYKLCADSLHHLVWLQLHQPKESDENNENSQSHETHLCEVFKGLQYGNNNLSKGSPESLCLLDLEAFLQAAVYTTSLLLERRSSVVIPRSGSGDFSLSVAPDICEPLCTKEQASWWKAAYYLFTNSIREKFGEQRRILQRGLEVIRGVGNHGLDVQLVVFLARLFGDRAASCVTTLKENHQSGKVQSEKIHLNHRCAHYWNVALGMLEKLDQNQVIRTPKECMFVNYNKDLSSEEITKLIEEGHLYLACQEMNAGKLDEAVSIFSKLTSPFASYYMALALKRSAVQQVEGKSMRDIDADTWNVRTYFLNRAKEAMYLTMDRLKGDKTHPLNKDLCVEVEDLERELNKDLNVSSPADDSGGSEEVDEYDDVDSKQMSPVCSRTSLPNHYSRLSRQSTPRPDSNFLTLKEKNVNINEKSKHLQPSPERLDAQIRALALSQESLVKTVLEQQRTLLDTTKAIAEEQKQHKDAIEQLKKQMEELRVTVTKGFAKSSHRKPYVRGQGDDEEEEDYFEGNTGYVDYFVDDAGEYEFRRSGYQHYVPPQLVPEPPGASGLGYVHQPPPLPGAPPGPPPLSHYGYQYPPHPPLAPPPPSGTAIPEHPQYFHSAPAQGLSFSEGQQLPQFRFHVGSPALKPPGAGSLGAVATTGASVVAIAPPVAPLTSKPPPMQHTANSPWTKSGSVPHAFQIPLPPLPTTTAFSPAHPPAALSTPTPFLTSSAAAVQKPVQTSCTPSTSVTPSNKATPPAQTFPVVTGSPLLNNSTGSSIPSPAATTSGFLNRTTGTPNAIRSRRDSDMGESAGSEAEGHDIEKEVLGDFKPVIPLPDEVVVQTGEENEKVIFEERAKLFRFVDHEWKERGIGPVRLLHNESTGKVRLLMRRDQVLKVCANHFILSSMQLSSMKGSDKAWIWAAQDFADETVKTEKFCIRFKTADIASSFKRAFEQSVSIVREAESGKASEKENRVQAVPNTLKSPVQTTSNIFSTKFLPKHGSWSCPVCYVSNAADKPSCEACETSRPQQSLRSPANVNFSPQPSCITTSSFSSSPLTVPPLALKTGDSEITITTKMVDKPNEQPASALLKQLATTQSLAIDVQRGPALDGGKTVFGGFTFSSTPVLKDSSPEAKDREILVVHTKAKNGPQVTKIDAAKPSPFSGFSFKSSSASCVGFGFTTPETSRSSSETSLTPVSAGTNSRMAVTSGVETRTTVSSISDSRTSVSSGTGLRTPVSAKPDARTPVSSVRTDTKTPGSSTSSFEKSGETPQSVFGANSEVSNLMFSSFGNTGTAVGFQKSENFKGFLGSGSPLYVTVTKEGRRVSGEFSAETAPEEFEPTTEFKPVVPLPALVEVKTGEEGEEKLFGERAKLFRYDNEGKQWKERGIGELKILYLPTTGRYRILMRREQVLKICANHSLLPEMKLSPLASSDRSWVWLAKDYSEGTLCEEKFAAKFKNKDIAQLFHSVFEECLEKSKAGKEGSTENSEQAPGSTPPSNQKPLSEIFKPAPDSWECNSCYVRNDASKQQCVSCDSPKPLSALFKSQPGSWECGNCYVRNEASAQRCVACESAKPGGSVVSTGQPPETTSSGSALSTKTCSEIKKSFADLFKPDPGSWECQTCYIRNSKDKTVCVACETPKPGCEYVPQKPTQQTSSNVFGQFTFVSAPKSSTAETPQSSSSVSSNFVFGNTLQSAASRSGFVFGSKPSVTSTTFGFGQSSVSQPSKDSFGFKPSQSISGANNSSTVFGGASISSNFGTTTSVTTAASVPAPSSSISIPPVTAPPTYVFGNVSSNTTAFSFGALVSESKEQDASESVEFRFGSPQKYEFSFSGVRARSPSKTPKSPKVPGTPTDVEDEDEVEPSDVDSIYFQPVIPLPPKVDVKTGEEDETLVFNHRAKLFRFDQGEWKERGIGDIKILFNPSSKSFRLLMRREQVLKVCLNHKLTADINFIPKGDKSLQWAATDFSDNEPKPEQLAVRFKTPETLAEFKNAIDDIMKQLMPSSVSSENKTTSVDSFHAASPSVRTENENAQNVTSPNSTRFTASPTEKPVFGSATPKSTSEVSDPTAKLKDTVVHTSSSTGIQSPVTASTFSFKMAGLNQAPGFSLSSRFNDSQLPAKSVFGNVPAFGSTPSPAGIFSFKKMEDEDKDIEVIESKSASEEKRESAEKLKLPSNFYLYEDKPPCPGCRGCETGHTENDEIEVIYQAEASATQIDTAIKLLLPPTFYLYENKPPCPGCRGCRDEIPDHVGVVQTTSSSTSISKYEEREVEKQQEQLTGSSSVVSKPEDIETKPFFTNTTVTSFSFADLAAKGSGFGALASKVVSPSKVVFAGTGTPVFASLSDSKNSEDDDSVVAAPDIHFEPVIPLPDLVDVKTGEEEETPIFCHRAKLYRFDSIARQWKERGIGDFKILKHNDECRFRIILRREQVHKVACNHYIKSNMKLNPMDTTEIALCWNTVDYAEGRPETSSFAVKFKNKEILEQFRSKFEECVAALSQNPSEGTPEKASHVTASSASMTPSNEQECAVVSQIQQVDSADKVIGHANQDGDKEKSQEDTQGDNCGEDDDDDDSDILFEKRVSFEIFDEQSKSFTKAGLGSLRVLYDDAVFGYRINVTSDQNVVLSDHIIAVQTSLRVDKKVAVWAAIDMVVDPPKRRQFRATFSSIPALIEFETIFNEGKQTAIQAQIVEKVDDPPMNFHAYETATNSPGKE